MAFEQELMMERNDEHAAGSRDAVVVGLRLVVAVAGTPVVAVVAMAGPDAVATAEAAQMVLEKAQMEPSNRLEL